MSLPPGDANVFWRRILTGLMGSLRGTGYGQIIAANQIFGAFGNTAKGAQVMGGAGLSGAGGAAAATGLLMAAMIALQVTIKSLQVTIRESIAASERARVLYARALGTGLGLNITARQSTISQVLGVSESEIYQFGAALAFLNPRLEGAIKIQAETARTLAPLSYEMRILRYDIEALFDKLAVMAVPVLRALVDVMDELVKSGQEAVKTIAYIAGALSSLNIFKGANPNKMAADLGAILRGILGPLANPIAKGISDAQQKLGPPQSFMKQMPVSSLERMGLVTSIAGGGMDYARRTAVATEKTAHLLTKINGVPRGDQFGMSPNVSNP
jgi:hypothetical protein